LWIMCSCLFFLVVHVFLVAEKMEENGADREDESCEFELRVHVLMNVYLELCSEKAKGWIVYMCVFSVL
jgi:hypothetical protein